MYSIRWFAAHDLAFPFLSLLKKKSSQCSRSFTVVKYCPGSLRGSQSQEAIFPQKASSSLVQHVVTVRPGLWACGFPVPLHTPFWSSFSPQALRFFSLPSSEIVFLTSVGPSLFPAIKTGPGGRRCLENVVIIAHTHTHMQGPLSSSLVNDAPNLARSRNESKVSSHHHHHHHHSSAGPWLSPSHIICSRENIIFFCQASLSLSLPLFSLLLTLRCYSFFSYLPLSLSLLLPL